MKPEWQALDKALNRWEAAKYKIWREVGADPKNHIMVDVQTFTHVCRGLAAVGRSGYRSIKGMDLLELYVSPETVADAVEKAHICLKLIRLMSVDRVVKRELRAEARRAWR